MSNNPNTSVINRHRQWTIRPGVDSDTQAILELVRELFGEYGLLLDPVLDAAEHYQPQTGFANCGGAFCVAWGRDRLLGTAAIHPISGCGCGELRRFYVCQEARGTGLALALTVQIQEWCLATSTSEIRLWTDARFQRSHAFYTKIGFVRTGRTQQYHDVNNTTGIEFAAHVDNLKLDHTSAGK
ncbi:MAG: GNAT family N-acetyltransferase [Phycisphaerales bacterium]